MKRKKEELKKTPPHWTRATDKGGDRAKIKRTGLTERQPYTNDLQQPRRLPIGNPIVQHAKSSCFMFHVSLH